MIIFKLSILYIYKVIFSLYNHFYILKNNILKII